MSVHVRPLGDKDFFPWLGLFEGYSEFYESELTDEKALRVWSWIIDKNHDLDGAVAVDENGELVGFVHFREFPRTLSADQALFLDDLYVVPSSRSDGIGRQLMAYVKDYAKAHNLHQVQWLTAADNEAAQRLYDDIATRTEWVTYEQEV